MSAALLSKFVVPKRETVNMFVSLFVFFVSPFLFSLNSYTFRSVINADMEDKQIDDIFEN